MNKDKVKKLYDLFEAKGFTKSNIVHFDKSSIHFYTYCCSEEQLDKLILYAECTNNPRVYKDGVTDYNLLEIEPTLLGNAIAFSIDNYLCLNIDNYFQFNMLSNGRGAIEVPCYRLTHFIQFADKFLKENKRTDFYKFVFPLALLTTANRKFNDTHTLYTTQKGRSIFNDFLINVLSTKYDLGSIDVDIVLNKVTKCEAFYPPNFENENSKSMLVTAIDIQRENIEIPLGVLEVSNEHVSVTYKNEDTYITYRLEIPSYISSVRNTTYISKNLYLLFIEFILSLSAFKVNWNYIYNLKTSGLNKKEINLNLFSKISNLKDIYNLLREERL